MCVCVSCACVCPAYVCVCVHSVCLYVLQTFALAKILAFPLTLALSLWPHFSHFSLVSYLSHAVRFLARYVCLSFSFPLTPTLSLSSFLLLSGRIFCANAIHVQGQYQNALVWTHKHSPAHTHNHQHAHTLTYIYCALLSSVVNCVCYCCKAFEFCT